MLPAMQNLAPKIFPLDYSAYSSSSSLFGGDKTFRSLEDVQQGATLGPLLFCLSLHQDSQLSSELCACYLDDITLEGGRVGGGGDGQGFHFKQPKQ